MAAFFDEIRGYVGFTDADSAALKRLAPALPRVVDELVEDFYGVILAHEDARRVLADEAQLNRLKGSLREWASTLLSGPHDQNWFAQRSLIGERHVEVGLAQRFMPLAMSRLRRILCRLALEVEGREAEGKNSGRLAAGIEAVNRVLDLELAIMLESYNALSARRVRQAERLGVLGQLAASVSHELKNPLAVINTSLLLLKHQLDQPIDQRDSKVVETHMQRIARSSRQAARMAGQLLDYSRVKKPAAQIVVLKSVLDDGLLMVEDRRGVEIEVRCEPEEVCARCDGPDLAQVVANLVRNAIQAIQESGASGHVTLRARRDETGVTLTVSDDGPGIAAEHLGRVFEPLFTTRTTGTGLGLAIARDLVEANDGRLTVSSKPGQGAVFTIHLPQEAAVFERRGG